MIVKLYACRKDVEAEVTKENPEISAEQLDEIMSRAKRDMEAACIPKLFDHILTDDNPSVLYADLQDAIAAHSPNIATPSSMPLVITGPFGEQAKNWRIAAHTLFALSHHQALGLFWNELSVSPPLCAQTRNWKAPYTTEIV